MALDLFIGEHGGSIVGGAAGAYHGTNVNVLFLDDHVDSVPFKTNGAWFWRHTGQ
jgi:prepilin-type processing-associated H-X9-DG protein